MHGYRVEHRGPRWGNLGHCPCYLGGVCKFPSRSIPVPESLNLFLIDIHMLCGHCKHSNRMQGTKLIMFRLVASNLQTWLVHNSVVGPFLQHLALQATRCSCNGAESLCGAAESSRLMQSRLPHLRLTYTQQLVNWGKAGLLSCRL